MDTLLPQVSTIDNELNHNPYANDGFLRTAKSTQHTHNPNTITKGIANNDEAENPIKKPRQGVEQDLSQDIPTTPHTKQASQSPRPDFNKVLSPSTPNFPATPHPPSTPRPSHTPKSVRIAKRSSMDASVGYHLPVTTASVISEKETLQTTDSYNVLESVLQSKIQTCPEMSDQEPKPVVMQEEEVICENTTHNKSAIDYNSEPINTLYQQNHLCSENPSELSSNNSPSILENVFPIAVVSVEKSVSFENKIFENLTDSENEIQGLILKNISNNVTLDDLTNTLGILATDYTRTVCSCSLGREDSSSNQFAIVTAPAKIIAEIEKLNKIEICDQVIEIARIPLEIFEVKLETPISSNDGGTRIAAMEDKIMDFLFKDETDVKKMSHCLMLSQRTTKDIVYVHAALVSALKFPVINPEITDSFSKIDGKQCYELLQKKHNERLQTVKMRKKTTNQNQIIEAEDLTNLTREIRQYSMNICKQMKRKLQFLSRKNYQIRSDKGSTSREQLYIDCSTAIYEFFRFYLMRILKEKMNCTEDLTKRRTRCDANPNNRSDVEAQYSLQFEHNGTRHNVHITFYYTKCSLFIQGQSSKINNLTIAQYFACQYIEKISEIIEETVPLDDIGKVLRERITSFLSKDEALQISNGDGQLAQGEKCVSCPRKCHDNDKSMRCSSCKKKQHFNCAGIRDDDERQIFLTGSLEFICDNCVSDKKTTVQGPNSKPCTETGQRSNPSSPCAVKAGVDNVDMVVEEIGSDLSGSTPRPEKKSTVENVGTVSEEVISEVPGKDTVKEKCEGKQPTEYADQHGKIPGNHYT